MQPIDLEGMNGWQCVECAYISKYKTHVMEHVEARHVASRNVFCPDCGKLCPNKKSLRNHQYNHHRRLTEQNPSFYNLTKQ
jgi:hypothetical protein